MNNDCNKQTQYTKKKWTTLHNEQRKQWPIVGTKWKMDYNNNCAMHNELHSWLTMHYANINNIMATITIQHVTIHND